MTPAITRNSSSGLDPTNILKRVFGARAGILLSGITQSALSHLKYLTTFDPQDNCQKVLTFVIVDYPERESAVRPSNR
jgi:hypothetical protein